TEEKVNLEVLENNQNEVEFLIFKQAIDTGWDCPRAQILVKFRQTKSEVFELQTIGRILRMPEATHYQNDKLNKAFIYTNIKSKNIDFKGNEISLKNAIKSLYVERESIYKPIELKSYYRNRVDFGDLTMGFREVFAEVFCEHFDIKKDKVGFGMFGKNRKKLESKGVKFKNLENQDEIVINGEIDTKYFDNLPEGKIKFDNIFSAKLSENDFENAFKNIIKENLNGFAPARSISTFKEAIVVWFKKYLGIDPRKNNGMIFVKNIVFNNYKIFGKLFDKAVREYKPVKEKEIQKRIEEVEEWNNKWEIEESRNYNPDTHKPFGYKLSLYKHPQDKKVYLNFDSEIEKEFVEFLEK
ncbi:MAG: hypothetical protein L6275_01245, partial [Candidatus Portnoybacteria bacterium]|nr:hypothetical protein [Candidatus Portnoybacteria bacterium]